METIYFSRQKQKQHNQMSDQLTYAEKHTMSSRNDYVHDV